MTSQELNSDVQMVRNGEMSIEDFNIKHGNSARAVGPLDRLTILIDKGYVDADPFIKPPAE